jgi:hypothetical protein
MAGKRDKPKEIVANLRQVEVLQALSRTHAPASRLDRRQAQDHAVVPSVDTAAPIIECLLALQTGKARDHRHAFQVRRFRLSEQLRAYYSNICSHTETWFNRNRTKRQ